MGLKLSENLVQYIREEVERVEYGRITIELNGTSNKIDVITEHRKRFPKEGEFKLVLVEMNKEHQG